MKNLKDQSLKFLDLRQENKNKKLLFEAFNRVLSSSTYILGKEVEGFEKQFAKYLGVKYCIGVGNGLESIQISLMALGIGKEDEVITTPISAVATTLAILAVGGKPVFVDVLDNGLINPDLIPSVITKKTKAILPVHLYGNPAQINKIKNICKKYKLFLVEDAAQAHGSSFKDKKLGTFGNLGCFSFYPTKNLGALGDGGAIVTNNKNLAKACYETRDYGQKGKYNHVRFGLNSRLDTLQASLLSVKLKNLDSINYKRRKLAQKYLKNLTNIENIQIVKPIDNSTPNYHLFVIKSKNRNKLQNFLAKKGITTLIHYPRIIPDQPFLKKEYGKVFLPKARSFVKSILSLPLHPNLTITQVDYICKNIKDFFIKT